MLDVGFVGCVGDGRLVCLGFVYIPPRSVMMTRGLTDRLTEKRVLSQMQMDAFKSLLVEGEWTPEVRNPYLRFMAVT